MIRINVQDPKTLAGNRAVANAVNALRARSFSERHQELGKMLNCYVCDRRHREPACTPKYYEIEYIMMDDSVKTFEMVADQETRKGVLGAAVFAKKRFLPHHSKKNLQLVQLTQQLYPQHAVYFPQPEDAMKEARKEARRLLKKKRSARHKLKAAQQEIARSINFGLAKPGSRIVNIHGTLPSRNIVLLRRKKQDERTKRNKEATDV